MSGEKHEGNQGNWTLQLRSLQLPLEYFASTKNSGWKSVYELDLLNRPFL